MYRQQFRNAVKFIDCSLPDEHIKETKFPRNDKTSQWPKSVARSAGGLKKCQAEN